MRRRLLVIALAVVVVLVVAVGGWWWFLRDDAPDAVSLGRASRSLDRDRPADDAATLDGRWSIDPTVGSFADFSGSFVGFRVEEQLAGIGAKTAVGRTPDVTGSLTIAGTDVTAATFTIDLTTITTDDSRRDNALRNQSLETARFPTATFTLTSPIALGRIPAEDERIAVAAKGDLTLHGVTRPIVLPLEARRAGDTIAVVGTTSVAFADHAIAPPRSAIVLSVADVGTVELQLFFTRDAA